jgi:hypothetical protein
MKNKTGIQIIDTVYWKWIVNHDYPEDKRTLFKEEIEKEYHGTIGKYLFFSKNREELIELAEKLLKEHDLYHAKTPSSLQEGYEEYVLCVYDIAPNLTEEMKQYKTETIKYRYWKSDEATMRGVE